jgi:aminoglycoside phosphotransferase (APT) family kinase protein
VAVTLAPDPVLGPLEAALDGDAVREALGSASCRPTYVKYKPGHHLQVLYEIDDTLGHLTMLRPKRAERLWARVAPLTERVPGAARHLPELAAVLQLYPVDVRLPGLVDASSPALLGVEPELVRYKPGKRAVLRYPADCGTVYGKLRADDAGEGMVALGRSLAKHGIPTPPPLAYLSELRMTVHAEAHGTRLAKLHGAELERWMEPVAEALARLHGTRIDGLPAYPMEREAAELRDAGEVAAALLGRRFDALIERLVAGLDAVEPRVNTVHGSFHDDQVLVGEGGLALLDLDSAALGHPLLDVGHFAAYMSARGEEAARARWLEACAPGPDALLFEAASLVRWSSLPFRRLAPNWADAMEHSFALAGERLAEHSGTR